MLRRSLLTLSFLLVTLIGSAQAQRSSYGALQAAYLYNFAKYITWPDEQEQFVIGIYLDADIIADLETVLKGKRVRGKAIEIKKVTTIEDVLLCNIIYVSGANSKSIELLTTSLEGKNILLVTEDDLVRKGATVSFVVEDDKLKFKVKKTLLDKAGLVASEGLLKLAIVM
jgi:hypothetical protein